MEMRITREFKSFMREMQWPFSSPTARHYIIHQGIPAHYWFFAGPRAGLRQTRLSIRTECPRGNIFVVSDVTDGRRAEEALKIGERLAATVPDSRAHWQISVHAARSATHRPLNNDTHRKLAPKVVPRSSSRKCADNLRWCASPISRFRPQASTTILGIATATLLRLDL